MMRCSARSPFGSITMKVGASPGEADALTASAQSACATITVLPAPLPASTVTCDARSSDAAEDDRDGEKTRAEVALPEDEEEGAGHEQGENEGSEHGGLHEKRPDVVSGRSSFFS